jgi:hypothetical protein
MAVGKHRRFAIHLIGPARPEHRPDGEIFSLGCVGTQRLKALISPVRTWLPR